MVNLAENNAVSRAGELQSQGFSDAQIYEALRKDGFNSVQIDEAINEAKVQPSADLNLEDAPEPGLRPSMLNNPQANSFNSSSMTQQSYSPSFKQESISDMNFQSTRENLDDVEALIESIIEEKWKNSMQRFGSLDVWKERMKTDVVSIKQELIRLEHRFDNIEKAILGKINQYDRNIVNIGNEMKVLEQVFQKIIDPLTSNIKELSRITKELKEK